MFVTSIAQIIKNSGGVVPDYMLQMKKVRKSEVKMRAKKPLEREDISTKIRAEKLPLPKNLDKPRQQEKSSQQARTENKVDKLKKKPAKEKGMKNKLPVKGKEKLKQNKKK